MTQTPTPFHRRPGSSAALADGDPIRRGIGVLAVATALLASAPAGAQSPAGAPFLVHANPAGDQLDPTVCRQPTGEFAVAWVGGANAAGNGAIVARVFESDGSPRTDEIVVHPTSPERQREPSIACRSDGGFLVTWAARGADAAGFAVLLRAFNSTGAPLFPPIVANQTGEQDQRRPAVCAGGDGGSVLVWQSLGQDGDEEGIYTRRLGADGAALGPEVQVNQSTALAQQWPAVDCDPDGGALVAWESEQADVGRYRVHARRLRGDGAPNGDAFAVGDSSVDQRAPGVAWTGNTFVVAWLEDAGTTGRIFARRLDAGGLFLDAAFPVDAAFGREPECPRPNGRTNGEFDVVWSVAGRGEGRGVYGRSFDPGGMAASAPFRIDGGAGETQGSFIDPGRGLAVDGDRSGSFVVVWQSGAFAHQPGGFDVLARVYVGPPTPTPEPTAVSTPTPTAIDTATPAPTPTPTHRSSLPGDSDCSGVLDEADLVATIAAIYDAEAGAICDADCNRDGAVTAADVLCVRQKL